ncbi:MAG: HAMP domain-containing histidine kinase, partial [Planctomycetes bacterium]|nr:HAMP domain-containing histidine kinase [Planctomycetota bacterium]
RRRSVATLEALRGWIFPPRPTEPAVEGGEPERLYEERPGPSGRRPALAVWTRHAPAPSGPGAAASGFLVDLHGLEEALARCLASVSPGTRLSAQALRRAEDDGFIDLAGLGGQRSFVRLGLEKRAWQERLGEARRPFKLAGGLIAVLMAVLVLGFVVLFRGVRAEMALSRLKTEFVANVSHELKTPLALIRLYGETLLLDRAPPGERRTYYQVITRESERLAHLIAKVLSFSSIEAGKKSYDLTATDVARVVRDTLETYRPHLEAQGFRHRLELPAERAVARADPDAVAQAVINLLENAVKYSRDEKEVTVAVREDGPWILVSVADRGIGVSPEDRDRVFEDYYRTKEARAIGTRGSGLGLSLVQHIMKAHGGRVDLQSEAGKGSVFTLRFPRLEDATRDSEVTR